MSSVDRLLGRTLGDFVLREKAVKPSNLLFVGGDVGSPVLDDVIARGLRLIEAAALETVTGDAQAGQGVQLDETTARLLSHVFHVVPTLTGYQLRSAA